MPAKPPRPPASAPLSCKSARPARRTSRTAFIDEAPSPDDPLLAFAPYVHKAPRQNSITPERQRAFIAALAASGIVTQAARTIGASLEALYKLRHRAGAEGFAEAWNMALDRGIARLEDCVLERAILGEERPVVSHGKLVTTWRYYNTALVLFLLRQRRPERFAAHLDVRPGSATFERVRAMIEAERPDPEDILASIDAKLDLMRQRSLEASGESECETGADDDI